MSDTDLQRLVHKRLGRRGLFVGALSRGSLALLTGCNLEDDDAVDRMLFAVSRFNDRVQAALFRQDRLAPTYTARDITDPFPFNAYYEEAKAPEVDGGVWKLELTGRIENKTSWSLADLNQLPQTTQITRHICIEGWSAIGQWSGVPLGDFLRRVGADTRAPFIAVRCADGYSSSLDMATALHPQTQITLRFRDQVLPRLARLGLREPARVAA